MNLSICTISFRHQLLSIEEIASWAQKHHFQGIELWGAHAKNLADQPQYNQQWLSGYNLRATMISDYLPLDKTEQALKKSVQELAQLAVHWGAKKIRTFAGGNASQTTSVPSFNQLVSQLQKACDWLAHYQLNLIIEIHPNTYADTVESTLELFKHVARDNMKVNFDVLHVWESKAEVIPSLETLLPYIDHCHFQNLTSAEYLDVFTPATVYSASGSREGMVSLFEGAVDYNAFIQYVAEHANQHIKTIDSSLEWFGGDCKETLNRDRYLIQQLYQQSETPIKNVVGI
jgi:3-dehydroshikimate dehydratase